MVNVSLRIFLEFFDWHPQKYNFLTVYSDAESIATSFETLSILNRLQEGADFEIDYLFFLKFYSGRDWFSNKKKLIEQNLKDICGKEFNLLVEEDSDEFRKILKILIRYSVLQQILLNFHSI